MNSIAQILPHRIVTARLISNKLMQQLKLELLQPMRDFSVGFTTTRSWLCLFDSENEIVEQTDDDDRTDDGEDNIDRMDFISRISVWSTDETRFNDLSSSTDESKDLRLGKLRFGGYESWLWLMLFLSRTLLACELTNQKS